MKKVLISILFIIVVFCSYGQKQKIKYLTTFDDKLIHFGFTIGVNTLDFSIANYNPIGENPDGFIPEDGINGGDFIYSDVATLAPGFTVAIISSLRLSEDFALRFLPGLSFGERKLTFNVPVKDINDAYEENTEYYSIKSTFLDFPLLIKYKARRINNDRPYVIFGGAYRQDISRTAQEDLIKLKNGGVYAEVGGGWDHYFPFFRFSVEAKFSFGLNNQLGTPPNEPQRQYYSQSIKNMRSKIFTLAFHFE